jgi:hypothetical protein
MNPMDTAKAVLAKASFYDSRMPTPDINVARAWAEVLGNVALEDALAAVAGHYTAPAPERIMPGDVLAGVRKLRSQRIKDNYEDFPELDGVAHDTALFLATLRACRAAVADGTYGSQPVTVNPLGQAAVRKAMQTAADALPQIPAADNGSTARAKALAEFDRASREARDKRRVS